MAVMKKTALAAMSLIVLFSTVVISQTFSSVNANPNWRPWENAPTPPIITILSPLETQSCISSKVILDFTVTKPLDWGDSDWKIESVSYFVDYEPKTRDYNASYKENMGVVTYS